MTKPALIVLILSLGFTSTRAQDLLTQVPATASAVIRYSGENLSKSLPAAKLDKYGFVHNELFKMLKIDSTASINDLGIDLQQDIYQYFLVGDSSSSFVTLLHIKDSSLFTAFIKKSSGASLKTEMKNGYRFLIVSDNTYTGIKENTAIIVNTTFSGRQNYAYNYDRRNNNRDKSDTTIIITPNAGEKLQQDSLIVSPPKLHPVQRAPAKRATAAKGIPKKGAAHGTRTPAKRTVPLRKLEDIEDVQIDDANEQGRANDARVAIEDSIENMKRELWDQQQDMRAKAKQHEVAGMLIAKTFSNSITSISTDPTYKKIVDPSAHLSAWINSENLMSMFSNYYFNSLHSSTNLNRAMGWEPGLFLPHTAADSSVNFRHATNVYFDKDKVRVEQKVFSADATLAGLGRQLMDNKQIAGLANYVNQGNIGYLSMSVNTEAMAHYYYTILKRYFHSSPYTREYGEIADLYIDFLEISIDEKALSDLMPGNMLFVMHDLKPKTVTYTDYTFDDNYNKTEVKKTKTELTPDFTFAMETRNSNFMEKLARLPLKYAEKEKYDYKDMGGYYQLSLDRSNLLGKLYFIAKEGKVIVTTSKDVIDLTLTNKGFPVDAIAKKSILNNNYSLRLNSAKLFEKLGADVETSVNRKIRDYAIANIGDVKVETGLKDGMIQSTATLDIKGNHANSLEFFFNMIDSINNIVAEDKLEKEKKLD